MPLVAFLRGVNVGGHRTFRPTVLARALASYDVVNVGAAGTFVIRRPGSRAAFRAALLRALPFDTEVMLCDARDLAHIVAANPFGAGPRPDDVVWFVSILSRPARPRVELPAAFPSEEEWLVRVTASEGRFVFGMYRRDPRTIRYLGEIDRLYDVPATTRNWNTIAAVARVLQVQPRT
jgi:uncharacterized protein (DUF1697 family)